MGVRRGDGVGKGTTWTLCTGPRSRHRVAAASCRCTVVQACRPRPDPTSPKWASSWQVGGFAHGKIDASWVDEELNVSEYPLSAAYALGRITNAFEMKWRIV